MAAIVMGVTLAGAAAAGELQRAPAATWRVTKGRIEALADGRARVREPKMRAVVPGSDGNDVELRFSYDGAAQGAAPLASGQIRRQIGLKLRAENGCNLVYVMWRLLPKAELVVSVKSNPGKRTHAECGARGYTNLKGAGTQPAPPAIGSEHRLHAVIEGTRLRVWADRVLAWEGELPPTAMTMRGPAGVRSDNGAFTFELLTRAGGPSAADRGGGDED